MENNISESKLPSSLESEKSVLACVLIDPKLISVVMNELTDEDFFFEKNILIFRAMHNLHTNSNRDVDVISVFELLASRDLDEKAGGHNYLIALKNFEPSTYKLKTYIEIVKSKSIARQIITSCSKISDKILKTDSLEIDEIIDYAETEIYGIANKKTSQELEPINLVMEELVKTIESRKENKNELTGISSGFRIYDKITQGFQPGELIILAARPAMGKSAFAVNLAINVAKTGKSVGIFTLEMSSGEVASRMLSKESLIRADKIKSGRLENNEWGKLIAAAENIKKLNIHFDDSSSIKITELYSKCRHLHQQGKLDFLLIDYLQLLSGSNSSQGNRVNEIGEISRKLKSLARDLKIPVLALSQLSRSVESRQDKRPLMSDLRESGSIEQDADIVMFLYREDYYTSNQEQDKVEENLNELVELDIKKNRSGSLGTVKLSFNKTCGSFTTYYDTDTSIDHTI